MSADPAPRSRRDLAEVFALQSYDIDDNWFWISRFLSQVERPDWTQENVRDELEAARAQLWGMHSGGIPSGIWITRLEGDRGILWIAAGQGLEDGLRLFAEHTVPWLKEKGCKYVQVFGRRGWGRVMPGFEEVGTILRKDL